MHFLLYIPDETRQSRAVLADAGFGDLLKSGDPDPLVTIPDCVGPDKKTTGAIVLPFSDADESNNPPLGFLPDRQTWIPIAASDCWVGWVTASPPTADDLARSTPPLYPGPAIELNDGNEWVIPSCMDQKHVMVPAGAGWTTKECKRWPDLYTLAEPVLAMIEANQTDDIDFDYGLTASFISEVLRLNYRLTPQLIGALSLLDQDSLPRLAALATDYVRILTLIQELAQKKQPAPNS
jgi:hypothetical protein